MTTTTFWARTILLAVGVLLCSSGAASATEVGYARKLGVGAIFGSPTGLSGKAWFGPTNAVDLGIGFYGYGFRGGCYRDRDGRPDCGRRWRQSSMSLHADYLWQSKLIEGKAQLDWHVGVGARGFFLGDPCGFDCWGIGVRGPIGLDLAFDRPGFLELFLEIAPVFYVAPALFLAVEGGFGVRGYF